MPVETADAIDLSFKFFGLEPTVSLAAVKEAFRRYVKEFHPDTFPAGSDAQKLASEKLIAANSHYEKLKAYFEVYPNGKPREPGEARAEPQDESDWEAYDKQRHSAFDDELKEWKARQATLEKGKQEARGLTERTNFVGRGKMVLGAITVLLWLGWFSQLGKLEHRNDGLGAFMSASELYDLQTHGTSHSAYAMSDSEIHSYWAAKRAPGDQSAASGKRDSWSDLIYLIPFTLGVGWLFFSTKAKAMTVDYVHGKKP